MSGEPEVKRSKTAGAGGSKPVISFLDYGAGNVRSVRNALTSLGYTISDVTKPEDLDGAQVVVFPGVGSFGSAINTLDAQGFTEPLRRYLQADRPFFGICLGMQTLFEGSEESVGHKGLGIIPGTVKAFDNKQVTSPHIGWNGVLQQKPSTVGACLEADDMMYYVHSYRALPSEQNKDWVLSTCTYGEPENPDFIAAIQKGNVVACQFHPEKSGQVGLKLLKVFLEGLSGDGEAAATPPPAPPAAASGTGKRRTRLGKRIVACLDVRTNDDGDLVVTKGDQYDVRERGGGGDGNGVVVANGGTAVGDAEKGQVRNLGKPVELSARYYDEGADEICFLNITSFREGVLEDAPMLKVLERASERVFVPLTVGGGIRGYTAADGQTYTALEVAARYFRAGADKISLGSDAVYAAETLGAGLGGGDKDPDGSSSIEQISHRYGRQAVVVSVDPRRVYVKAPEDASTHNVLHIPDYPGPNGEQYAWYQATVKGGREGRDLDAVELARRCERLGAGELLLNCVDMDGQKKGFDLVLVKAIMSAVTIPVVASSGAGAPEHFSQVFDVTDVQAALAAGIFHRKEVAISEVKSHLREKGILVRSAA